MLFRYFLARMLNIVIVLVFATIVPRVYILTVYRASESFSMKTMPVWRAVVSVGLIKCASWRKYEKIPINNRRVL